MSKEFYYEPDFMNICLEQYRDLLLSIGIEECGHEEGNVRGIFGGTSSELYYKSVVKYQGHLIDVYIYEDEAQFIIDNQDNPRFECGAYETGKELRDDFIESLRNAINDL